MENELLGCPKCGEIWLYASVGDYGSGYENHGYRVNCKCGFAWKTIEWKPTEKEVIATWNRRESCEKGEK